jgi:hypothetical protein
MRLPSVSTITATSSTGQLCIIAFICGGCGVSDTRGVAGKQRTARAHLALVERRDVHAARAPEDGAELLAHLQEQRVDSGLLSGTNDTWCQLQTRSHKIVSNLTPTHATYTYTETQTHGARRRDAELPNRHIGQCHTDAARTCPTVGVYTSGDISSMLSLSSL